MFSSNSLLNFAMLFLLIHCPFSSSDADFIFNGFQETSNLSIDGSALILSGGALQLTNGSNHIMGHAFFHLPVQMLQNRSAQTSVVAPFSTSFVFDIVTSGSGSGHGLAFVVSPSKVLPGAFDQDYLGILGPTTNGKSSNHVFAIEFDTMSIRALNETNGSHVGVDINSLVSTVSEPSSYYTEDNKRAPVQLDSAKPIQAWVEYDGRTNVLNVTMAPISVPRPHRPLISTKLDLLPIFETNMYVGLSSATGKLASSHYILAWSFCSNGTAQPIDLSRLPKVPKPPEPSPPKFIITKIVALACASTLLVIAVVTVLVLWLRRRAVFAEILEDWEQEYPHRFPFMDLYKATKGFNRRELIGAGGFGQVYKGVLGRTRDEVAIKRISSNTRQGMREFVMEIASLGRMRHRHLVELRGWCKHGKDLLLVYEFMCNGSLDAHLFGEGSTTPLPWAQRFQIIKGVALGLVYLHHGWDQVVVHRDVKASNVLLGAGMVARLGDFGLARMYEHGADPATTRVVGTLGYMAPELIVSGRATTATDVFAFGALLLEVACGRRPIEPDGSGLGVSLVRWVRDLGIMGELLQAVDPRLQRCYEEQEAKLVLWLGLMCSKDKPENRPDMRQVCQYLGGEQTLQEDAVLTFSHTTSVECFGSAASMTWSSCGTMSTTSLQGGR